jgi:hypothetical protein
MARNRINPDLQLSLIVSSALALHVLTFPDLFLLDLFSSPRSTILTVAQSASMVGWIVLIFAPPVLIAVRLLMWRRFSFYLTVTASILPVGLVLVRIAHSMFTGDLARNYYLSFPIFLFSDLVVPALYWSMARRAAAITQRALGRLPFARNRP